MTTGCTASGPARSDQAVVFACDRRYLPYALFAAARLAALHPARRFDICLCSLDGDLVVPETLASLGLRVCRIDTGGAVRPAARCPADRGRLSAAGSPGGAGGGLSPPALSRFRCLPAGGDWEALLGLDLGGRAIGAVRDNLQWRSPGRRPEVFRKLGLGAAPYFNSGLLLIDVAAFRQQQVLERCLDFATAQGDRLVGLDQELLNAVLHGDWAELSPLWNWQYTRSSMLFEAMETAHLVHFIGGKKPWTHTGGALPRNSARPMPPFWPGTCPRQHRRRPRCRSTATGGISGACSCATCAAPAGPAIIWSGSRPT